MNFNEFQKNLKKFGKPICSCMFVGADGTRCKNKPISSHSLQKSGALRGIVSNGHVLSFQPRVTPDNADINIVKIGHSKASTFPGYCKRHDSELFAEIEEGFTEFTQRTYCLLTLRALSREYFTKLAQIRLFQTDQMKNQLITKLGLKYYQKFMAGTELSKTELENLKERLEQMLREDDYSNFIYHPYELEESIPFAFTGSFSPQNAFNDDYILPDFHSQWGVVFAFCGEVGSKSIFLISSLTGQSDSQIGSFFESVEREHPEPRRLALNLGLEYLENIFFSENWISGLSEPLVNQMKNKAKAGLPGREMHNPHCLSELDFEI